MAFLKYKNGELVFGLKEHRLADPQDRATPFYAYEWSGIASRYQTMVDAFDGKAELHFAMKSNSHPEILANLAKLGAGVDIVSGGELAFALKAGFPADRIVFSGVGKSVDELRAALRAGIQQINVESEPELLRIQKVAAELGVKAPVALRLNPDISAETHPYITTGFRENKFGLEKGAALRCLDVLKAHPQQLHFRGLTLHIGSQLFKLHDYRDALLWVLDFAKEVETAGFKIENLDLGGGLGIYYEADRHATDGLGGTRGSSLPAATRTGSLDRWSQRRAGDFGRIREDDSVQKLSDRRLGDAPFDPPVALQCHSPRLPDARRCRR